jgi:hypothetical protein
MAALFHAPVGQVWAFEQVFPVFSLLNREKGPLSVERQLRIAKKTGSGVRVELRTAPVFP